MCAAEDLKQDRDRGRDEAGVVDEEVGAILPKTCLLAALQER